MTAPTKTPSSGDIWHLSIDDLFATLPDKARLGGPGPFVINLSVSTAPIDLPPNTFGRADTVVYQVQRTEDRRPRHRLRLGPFINEDDADGVLEKVRDKYPAALTATADADDLRVIAAMQAKACSPRPAVPVPVAAPAAVEAPVTVAAPVEMQAPVPMQAPLATGGTVTTGAPVEAASRGPSVESTRTVRALTVPELLDDQTLRWFVIQLSLSEEAFDSEAVPNLDIFGVYRLYSVAGIDQGRIVHALRLGFFAEESAAGAVASYLAAFYDKPTIKRVSAAERHRFADQGFEPRKDIGATGKHAVIEITNERYVRERRSTAVGQKHK